MTAAKLCSILFYIGLAIVTCMLARQINRENIKTSYQAALQKSYLFGIFAILFVCSALRFNIGNDYRQYTITAHEAYVDGYVVTEIGFNWLVKIVYTLFGGEYYEIVFAIFAFVTLIVFLKALYEQSVDFTMSYFLFMTLGIYFQTYNTVRYYLVLAIALYAVKYVWQKDYIRFCICILFAACFHKSVLLVIPVYWIATFTWKKWHIIAGVMLSAVCFAIKGPVLALALKLYPSYQNTIYLSGGTSLSSIIRSGIIVAFYLWFVWKYGRKQNLQNETPEKEQLQNNQSQITKMELSKLRFYAQLNMLTLDVYVFFSFLPVVTRIAYYFAITQLLMIPMIIHLIPEEKVKKRVTILVIVTCVICFLAFLYTADRPGIGLLPYKSWIFQENRFTYK